MFSSIKRLATIATALIACSLAPATASAQDTPEANNFFGTVEIVRGVPLPMADYEKIKTDGCLIGPANLVAPVMARLERKERAPCSVDMFNKLDSVNKESSILWIVMKVPSGLYVKVSDKGTNVSANRLASGTYQFGNTTGMPIMSSDNYHASGGAYMAQALASLPAALLGGVGAQAVAGAMACKNCGGPQVINNNLLEANSGSVSNAATNVGVNIEGLLGCASSTCGTRKH